MDYRHLDQLQFVSVAPEQLAYTAEIRLYFSDFPLAQRRVTSGKRPPAAARETLARPYAVRGEPIILNPAVGAGRIGDRPTAPPLLSMAAPASKVSSAQLEISGSKGSTWPRRA